MLSGFAISMVSALLYHVANGSLTDTSDDGHWELRTPTTVGNLVRENPEGPLLLWIAFSCFSMAVFREKSGLSTATAAPVGVIIGSALTWGVLFLYARGWVRDE